MRQIKPYDFFRYCKFIPSGVKVNGFTLVELLLIIVILGILAVGAAPLLVSDRNVDQLTLREQALTILRQQQLVAMQQTPNCVQVVITATALGANQGNCSAPVLTNPANDSVNHVVIDNQSQWQLTPLNGGAALALPAAFRFDPLGRPQDSCSNGCRLAISPLDGASSYNLCVEAEGYIHSC